jgi:putative flippase GtrA/4-amino-4-deoxy-L-arabinose transferase-like glycosyltransferase
VTRVGPREPHGEANGTSNSHSLPSEQAGSELTDQRAGMGVLRSPAKAAAETGPFPVDGTAAAPEQTDPQRVPALRALIAGRHGVRGERHGVRFMVFAAIGASVFLVGLSIQIAMVQYLHVDTIVAYIIQSIVSIELSFLLNRYLTWRDRNVPFLWALWRFNTQKALATLVTVTTYAVLVRLGVQYIVANIAITAVLTPLNYVAGHYWSFKARDQRTPTAGQAPGRAARDLLPRGSLPTVSVVVPCKNNPGTIRATVDALLLQDYPALEEIIVVGDVNDPTWIALADVADPRLSILEQEPTGGRRDPNVKRDKGICKSRSDLIALVDSDVVVDADWLCWAVVLLVEQGGGLVAGGVRSIHDTFWGRFVDRNTLAAKTPRLPRPYNVTAENFGQRGFKPPITANAVFTRQLYEACPLDVTWSYGYEDYEWFWRLAEQGRKILFSGKLTVAHHHRCSFWQLGREYRRSAHGCAHFIRAHRECPLARKRLWQAILFLLGAAAGLVGLMIAAWTGYLVEAGALLGAVAALLVVREITNARSVEAAAYPVVGLALCAMYAVHLLSSLGQIAVTGGSSVAIDEAPPEAEEQPGRGSLPTKLSKETAVTEAQWVASGEAQVIAGSHAPPQPTASKPSHRSLSFAIAGVIFLGVVLRLWLLATKPDWQVDEVTYTTLGRNLLEHGTLNTPTPYGQPWSPFLFHPPFYFLLLARWFALTGPSIYHARLLGVLASGCSLSMLAILLCRMHGPVTAFWSITLVTFDGWLLYAQRVSYIENLETILIVAMFLAYQRALQRPSYRMFVITGLLGGCAAVFNHTAAYILLAVLINWLFVRREHRKHLVLIGTSTLVIAAYVTVMIHLFDVGPHHWYIDETLIQLRRVFGSRQSQGTLTSPAQFLHLITSQYALFVPSLLIAGAAVILLFSRLWRCWQSRNWQPLGSDTLLPAWALAGIVVFGASELRYTQYFSLFLIPLYCYLWTRVFPALRRRGASLRVMAGLTAVVLVASATSFALRVLRPSDNAYAAVLQYAERHIPHHAIVVAESSIAYEIPQRWCSPYASSTLSLCQKSASYIITWQTFLQPTNPFHSKILASMLNNSVPVARFRGWNGTVVVRKIR